MPIKLRIWIWAVEKCSEETEQRLCRWKINICMDFVFKNIICWLKLNSSERRGQEAAWRPVRTWVKWGCSSAGYTSRHAGAGRSAALRRWGRGTGSLWLGGGSTAQRAAWGRGGGCVPAAGCSTVEPCWAAGRACFPAEPCGPASHPEPSERPAPAYAVWLFGSETKPAETRTG